MKFPSKPNQVLVALLSTTLMAGASTELVAAGKEKAPVQAEYAKDSVLVKFKPFAKKADRASIAKSFGASFKDKNDDGVDDRFRNIANGRLVEFKLPSGQDPKDVVARLKRNPNVEYAELNGLLYPSVVPNDPQYSQLWGMPKISAEQGWEMEMGSKDIVVGVIDTGFDYTHPDLQANIWVNPNEVPDNGVDDDGNGYIDDIHGISAINDNGNPQDTHYHGTHVAGTIGATGNNGVGVVGVNWNTNMVGCSFLGSSGGTTADAIQCIDYMVDLTNRGVNVRVLNNSWGGGAFSQSLKDAIIAADNAGMLFVAAAGNDAVDNDQFDSWPANYDVPNVMSIASTTSTDAMSSFSQWGATTVDMGAPGSSIYSTVTGNDYNVLSGTSMATPHVAGAAALVLASAPNLTTADVKNILMSSGDPISSLEGLTVTGKRLNVENALNMAGAGGPGYYLLTTPGSRTVNQGSPTDYTIDMNAVGGYTGTATFSASAPGLNADISFSNSSVNANGSTVMTVATNDQTALGEYTITVTAVDGEITESTDVSLLVYPVGTFTGTFENTTPVAIPDNDPTGINSIINVGMALTITDLTVNVDISHTYISDLVVTLTSPLGQTVTLHDKTGGSADDLVATYSLDQYDLTEAYGDWVLNVSDNVGADTGTLNNWSMEITGGADPGTNLPPTVSVSDPVDGSLFLPGEAIVFNGEAIDSEEGNISQNLTWTSSLDGVIGTGASFTRSDLSQGTHQITVEAADSNGAQSSKQFFLYVITDGTTVSYEDTSTYPIRDFQTTVAQMEVPLGVTIGEMNVHIEAQHGFNNDMLIHLVSPNGTTVEIFDVRESGDDYRNLNKTFYPIEFNGENAAGTWELRIQDEFAGDEGNLNRWVLTFVHDGGSTNPGNEVPAVTISSPTGGSTFTEGDLVTFAGSANDAEDGDVTNTLVWSSDIQGNLGTGSSVSTSALSVGTHVVTATATDSASATGTAQVSVTVNPAPVNEAPVADFSFNVNNLDVVFSDASGDTDGSVVAWDWDFGDGMNSSLANPSHTYNAAGTYTVSLTVTDDQGASHSVSKTVSVSAAIDLIASAESKNGRVTADLSWVGGSTNSVDVYRDGVLVDTTNNDGSYTDRFQSSATQFDYQICEAGSNVCSEAVTVVAAQASNKGKGPKQPR
ncbi:S8 family serine peptidase [Kangiella sediminilitoris]|uniref:Subtilisin-like serine protease-like protein n=1 Tax=Kangiella sediminilitoris TaxID=1144748 RepID=A0A1B3B9P7_9GAMM|nr:S8 family serine peptidase [Kangiella sediminilitoris]AOE49532.1 Subtilisin-like serine protease-like protein [Kangiella sediminilitoris]